MADNENPATNGPQNFRYGWWDAALNWFRGGNSGRGVIESGLMSGPGGPANRGPDDMKSAVAGRYVAYARARLGAPDILDRRKLSGMKRRVYEGKLKALVDQAVRNGFHPIVAARLCLTIHAATNELRRVVRKTAVTYKEPAHRYLRTVDVTQTTGASGASVKEAASAAEDLDHAEVTAPGAPNLETGDSEIDALADLLELEEGGAEASDTPFEKWLKAADLDTWMSVAEQYASYLPAVWIRPQVIYDIDPVTGAEMPGTGRLTHIVYTPDVADVVTHPEDPTQAVAFLFWTEELGPDDKMREVCVFWTADMVQRFSQKWELLASEPNPLGRLPVTVVRLDQPVGGYYLDGWGDDLYEATIEVCGLKTIQNQRAKDAGFKQIAIQGDADKLPADQLIGGPEPIYLGDEATATVLDVQPNLDAFTQLSRERERSAESAHGVKEPEASASGVQSGYAKKIDAAEVIDESKRRRKFLAAAEQDLYSLTAKLLEVRPIPSIGKLDPSAELVVDFAEPKFDEDPERQARIDALELKMNKVSIVDVLKRANPDLSEAELVRLAYRNKRINEALMTSAQARLVDLLATEGKGTPGAAPAPAGPGAPPSQQASGEE